MKAKKTILILLFILLVAEIGIVGVLRNSGNEDEILMLADGKAKIVPIEE